MRIAIITDAWEPQVNGVVNTLQQTRNCLIQDGHDVHMITPKGYRSIPCPTYPEIRLSLFPKRRLYASLREFDPQSIHIATEGPLGLAARKYCLKHDLAFTTSYHTQFPQYVRARFPIPLGWSYRFLRWFHGSAERTFVPTPAQQRDLEEHGFDNVVVWGRGVDTETFKPYPKDKLTQPRPIWIYLGRVSVEKNIEAFLDLELPGTKFVIGDGPAMASLKQKYIDTEFLGYKFGADLAKHLAAGDVFVFPSRTDTYGLVMLEAMACGLPVAAYPVTGPIDVVQQGITGCLDEDLKNACKKALELNPDHCRNEALQRTWRRATQQFFEYLSDVKTGERVAPAPVQG